MKRLPNTCQTPACSDTAFSKGLCRKCNRAAASLVGKGLTTWEELEALGLIAEHTGSKFLAAFEAKTNGRLRAKDAYLQARRKAQDPELPSHTAWLLTDDKEPRFDILGMQDRGYISPGHETGATRKKKRKPAKKHRAVAKVIKGKPAVKSRCTCGATRLANKHHQPYTHVRRCPQVGKVANPS